MPDARDVRLKIDLTFPLISKAYAEQVRDALLSLYQHAVVLNPGELNEERGFISVVRCGHRLDPRLPCTEVARWEVGRGKVV